VERPGFTILSLSIERRVPRTGIAGHLRLAESARTPHKERAINAFEPVAQSVEHVTFNHGVVGSIPTGLTKKRNRINKFVSAARTILWRYVLCQHSVSRKPLVRSEGWPPLGSSRLGKRTGEARRRQSAADRGELRQVAGAIGATQLVRAPSNACR
jgi:hypothetical protein